MKKKCSEIGVVIHCWLVVKWYSHFEKSLAVPQRLDLELSYDQTTLFLSIYPRELKHLSSQKPVNECT